LLTGEWLGWWSAFLLLLCVFFFCSVLLCFCFFSVSSSVSHGEDEALPQLIVHTLEEVSAKTFVHKLAQGEKFQNWVT
jgi:hypothetical protein